MKKAKMLLLGSLLALTTSNASAAFIGDRTDFRDETIYFAMTTRFYDGGPKNNVCGWDHQDVQIANNDPDWRGDFKGLIDKLDYIKALGFTAIWITPIVQNCSGTDFHGYHAMDFSKVDMRYESRTADYGSAEDVTFQSLIDAAHAKGMKIILDIVLNHTGNFGEAHFAELFTRSSDIRNQANVSESIIPNSELLGSDYNEVDGNTQYARRFPYLKNSDGTNKDTHNYWHHVGTGWNWDYPNRWWGQIAGDCVDLNTENPAVSKYLVECYGKFIEMGVDGFRIDTTGHISRLTFNTSFIPQFMALGEKYKEKRLNGCPFYMFGECCARFSDVTYRNQPNLSSYFYTWKSPQELVDQWNWDETFWDNIYIKEGDDDGRYGNMALCEAEPSVQQESDNVFMLNGAWHEPDYSQASGFNIIDFPMHYNFKNAGAAVNVARSGDKYYNDASFNVVYVDSHDYCPGPDDGTRFNGGTAQWAENLALMFTFRGIPCIYYGSEVEFQAGKKVDAGGTDMPVKESGRAYFGHYLEGNVTASDFGVYTADGNVSKTLDGDLAQHIIRLNQIRAAVPALRKGQYTWDGCTANGGYAFKRAYKDSYALVAVNGGATFTGVPEGDYTDLVTGKTYKGGGTITVDAPRNQGQLRVLVKDWKGGKVGTDGLFIYDTTPVSHGGNPSFTDPGTTEFYTSADAVGSPRVAFTPADGSFRTETVDVTAQLNEPAVSGWYQINDGGRVTLTPGQPRTFTLGADMSYGQTASVNWSATDVTGREYTGVATYRKVDPNATLTIYVKAATAPYFYTWSTASGSKKEPNGPWPGKQLTDSRDIDGDTFYCYTFDSTDPVNFIFSNNGNGQSEDITDVAEDSFYEYDGNGGCKKLDIVITADPRVTLSPNGGSFTDRITVTARANANTTSATYSIDGASAVTFTGTTTFTLGADMNIGDTTTVTWTATDGTNTKTGTATYTKVAQPVGITVYYDNSLTQWGNVNIHYWGGSEASNWPGVAMEQLTDASRATATIYKYVVPTGTTGIIFNGGGNGSNQTVDITNIVDRHLYQGVPVGNNQNANYTDQGEYQEAGVSDITVDSTNDAPVYYNMQGIEVSDPTPGVYLMRRGNSVTKVRIN